MGNEMKLRFKYVFSFINNRYFSINMNKDFFDFNYSLDLAMIFSMFTVGDNVI